MLFAAAWSTTPCRRHRSGTLADPSSHLRPRQGSCGKNTDYSCDLSGKVAIVTGGNSGVGSAIVLELARLGASIVDDHVSNPETEVELEQSIGDLGDRAVGVQADVSSRADLTKVFTAAISSFGHADILINNAGIETRSSILTTTEEQYDRVLAVTLMGAFFATQIAA